jgi:dienelactone hydrolase
MKPFILFISISFFSLHSQAQKQFNVLDWKGEHALNTYLVQRMQAQYKNRRTELEAALQTKEGTVLYKEQVRKKIRSLFPDFPKTGLAAWITGTVRKEGYRIEKLVYESFPDHHVTANLYLPEGKGPFPAALLFCGHEDVSKATESYQRTAILFAKNGFVVMVVDPISQSERHQLTDAQGKPLTRGSTTEHTILNSASNLIGYSTAAFELLDNVRSLDYLVTRKEVDTARIGCLGNSGGAMQAIYFAGYDERVKVVAPCSYLATRERTLELTGAADGCAQIPDEGRLQLEMNDYLVAAAPKPLLVLAGRYDFIDYTGTELATAELRKVYVALGSADRISLFTYDDGHGISKPKREAAVTWFRKWLYNDPRPVKEGALEVLTDKELFATKAGQVNLQFKNERTVSEFQAQQFKMLSDTNVTRKKLVPYELEKIFQQLFRNSIKEKVMTVESKGLIKKDLVEFEKLILRVNNDLPMPVLLARNGQPRKIIIWLHDGGKARIADSSLMETYRRDSSAVLLADLRGFGETEDRADLNDPKYFNREYRNAMLSLHIGVPLAGQRVEDIWTLMHYLFTEDALKSLPVEIHATGFAAVPAMHVAAIYPRIEKLFVYRTIRSFGEIISQPLTKNWYSYVIPNVAFHYDLPDLVRMSNGRIIYMNDLDNQKQATNPNNKP